jgi:hypothetical protein
LIVFDLDDDFRLSDEFFQLEGDLSRQFVFSATSSSDLFFDQRHANHAARIDFHTFAIELRFAKNFDIQHITGANAIMSIFIGSRRSFDCRR